ncbi:MAG: diaminopimelate epimerase [Candidatus Bipolaricaulota bacterium]|nr:diaminopimelate epimerase [Candidatus Bipolaricaulota bacterium]
MTKLEFSKYQGCGNDFVIIDAPFSQQISPGYRGELARFICDRHFGIGADDVLYLEPSSMADAGMKIFDAQGPEADMCGNGIRCAGAYLGTKLNKTQVRIATNDGVKVIENQGGTYRVGLGRLRTRMDDAGQYFSDSFPGDEALINKAIAFPNFGELNVSIVNSGEPHCVIFLDDIEKEDIDQYGKNICENRELFPYGINVDLVQITGENKLKIRTYERGVFAETLACGTGAAASAGVAYVTGRIKARSVEVALPGGTIQIEIGGDDLYLIGPAVHVFNGHIEVDNSRFEEEAKVGEYSS